MGAEMNERVSPDYIILLLRDVRASRWVGLCAFLPDRFGVCGHFPPHPRITGLAFPTTTIKLSLYQQSNFPYRQAAQFVVDFRDVAADHVRHDLLLGGQRWTGGHPLATSILRSCETCKRPGGRAVVPFRRGALVSVAFCLIDGGVR